LRLRGSSGQRGEVEVRRSRSYSVTHTTPKDLVCACVEMSVYVTAIYQHKTILSSRMLSSLHMIAHDVLIDDRHLSTPTHARMQPLTMCECVNVCTCGCVWLRCDVCGLWRVESATASTGLQGYGTRRLQTMT